MTIANVGLQIPTLPLCAFLIISLSQKSPGDEKMSIAMRANKQDGVRKQVFQCCSCIPLPWSSALSSRAQRSDTATGAPDGCARTVANTGSSAASLTNVRTIAGGPPRRRGPPQGGSSSEDMSSVAFGGLNCLDRRNGGRYQEAGEAGATGASLKFRSLNSAATMSSICLFTVQVGFRSSNLRSFLPSSSVFPRVVLSVSKERGKAID